MTDFNIGMRAFAARHGLDLSQNQLYWLRRMEEIRCQYEQETGNPQIPRDELLHRLDQDPEWVKMDVVH